MSRRVSVKNQALADQIIRILRDADGFPLGTGDIARQLGMTLHIYPTRLPLRPRPTCWPDDIEDPGQQGQSWCARCRWFHQEPVWRDRDTNGVRAILNRLERDGEVEKVVLDDQRCHYWRRDDSDAPAHDESETP